MFEPNYYMVKDNDRFFWGPFLLGGLGGAAIVGLSRPRPVFVNGPGYNQYPQPYPPRPPYSGYGYYGGNYYY